MEHLHTIGDASGRDSLLGQCFLLLGIVNE